MDFRQYLRMPSMARIDLIPFINIFLLVAVFFLGSLFFVKLPVLNVQLPKAVTSDMINARDVTIIVTSENIIYVNDKVFTLKELNEYLRRSKILSHAILIKSDRRASVGRLVDIWDISRNLGFERINIASNQDE